VSECWGWVIVTYHLHSPKPSHIPLGICGGVSESERKQIKKNKRKFTIIIRKGYILFIK
jgi:hypothetical protein